MREREATREALGERRRLEDEGYGTGTAEAAASIAAFMVSGAGWMASALIGVLDPDGEHRPSAYWFDRLNGVAGPKIVERI